MEIITELFYFCVGAFAALVFVRHREAILLRAIKRFKNESASAIKEAMLMNRELEILAISKQGIKPKGVSDHV